MTEGFVGYGRLDAPLWLLGMEEHCLGEADAARRLAVLPSFLLTIGVTEAHRRYGFDSLPRGVAVWDIARSLAIACEFRSVDVGEPSGDVLLAELLPLPRPSNNDRIWPAAYMQLFPGYREYSEVLLPARASRLARLVEKHRPKIVVVHGARYHVEVANALLTIGASVFRDTMLGPKKPAHILRLGPTRVVSVHNFGRAAGWSLAAKNRLVRLVSALAAKP